MSELYRAALFGRYSRHMHETRAIGSRNIACPGSHMPHELLLPHLCGDPGLLDAEHSSESAAFVRTVGLYHLYPLHERKKILYLIELHCIQLCGRRQMQLPDAMAGIVKADFIREPAQRTVHFRHIVRNSTTSIVFLAALHSCFPFSRRG